MKRVSRNRGISKKQMPKGTERVTKNGKRIWLIDGHEFDTMREVIAAFAPKEDKE